MIEVHNTATPHDPPVWDGRAAYAKGDIVKIVHADGSFDYYMATCPVAAPPPLGPMNAKPSAP